MTVESGTTSTTQRAPARTAITHARVFDGRQLTPPRTVVIEGGVISADISTRGAVVVDAAGGVLLPGLIDAHVHLGGRQDLEQLCSWGVTTALDMGCWPPQLLDGLRAEAGAGPLADLRSAGTPAIGDRGPHAQMLSPDAHAVVTDPRDAGSFLAARLAQGSDFLKIVAEAPGRGGPDQPTINALTTAAHGHNLQVIVHALSATAVVMALDAGADVITHAPLDRPLSEAEVARMAVQHGVAVPTLVTMEGLAAAIPGASFASAAETVTALRRAGVTILAGSDANAGPGAPFQAQHGPGLHQELELLVAVGLTPVQALVAATSAPARTFELTDRGAVEPGLRADLVLLDADADPLADIRATRSIRTVWCAGHQGGSVSPETNHQLAT